MIFLTGCGTRASGQDKVLATVANKSITLADFRHKLSRLPSHYKAMTEKNRKQLLDDMIVESLFFEDAVRKGVARDKEVRELLDEAKKKIVIAKLIKTEVDDKVSVPEDEMKKFYEENKGSFKTHAMWRASHILVASEGEAKEILNELSKGKSFEILAGEKSIDATASRGGDVGYFRKDQVIPEFEKACINLKVGGMSGIVHTQYGYHVIKLTAKLDEAIAPYEEAAPAIENELKMKKRSELLGKLIDDLKNRYRVNIDHDAAKTIEALK